MSEARPTNPLVEQFRRGGVARELRLMAAQGLLPLKPEDLLELWTDLVSDPDEGVRAAAEKSLASFPAAELQPILKSRDTPAGVLAWAVAHRTEHELREAALQNHSLPDEAIEALAPTLPQALAELVVINQTRLLRRTSLLVALESNAGLSNDQKRRLRELRETFRIGEATAAPAPAARRPRLPPPSRSPSRTPSRSSRPRRRLHDRGRGARALPLGGGAAADREGERRPEDLPAQHRGEADHRPQGHPRGAGDPDPRPEPPGGDRRARQPPHHRARDRGHLRMKSVSDEILREIGNHREWTKRYSVLKNLVSNPRTPIGIALSLVPRLNPRDIKGIAVDRNVPEPVRKQAQKFVKAPGQQR